MSINEYERCINQRRDAKEILNPVISYAVILSYFTLPVVQTVWELTCCTNCTSCTTDRVTHD